MAISLAASGLRAQAVPGAQEGAYLIESFEDLERLSRMVAEGEGEYSGEVWLMNDIEAVRPFNPIGDETHMFTGIFDGRGHTVSGLQVTGENMFSGLFGYVGIGGTVRDVKLSDVFVAGVRYSGAVAAYSAGTIENCAVSRGTIHGKSGDEYGVSTGGIVGLSCGRVSGCAALDVQVSGGRCVGGIAGSVCGGKLEMCISDASVRSWHAGEALAGGAAGCVQTGGEVRGCIALGEVRAPAARWAGGIAGGVLSGKMGNCLALNEVIGREPGGTAGYLARRAQAMACRYAPFAPVGVGEGRQDGTYLLPGGRNVRLDAALLLPLICAETDSEVAAILNVSVASAGRGL